MRISKLMAASAGVLTAVLAGVASAAPISLYTAGSFATTGSTTGVSLITSVSNTPTNPVVPTAPVPVNNRIVLAGGAGTVTFNAVAQSFPIPDDGTAIGLPGGGYGFFVYDGTAGDFSNVNFSLTITQTTPSNGAATFPGTTLNGTLFGTNGNLTLTFADPTTQTIGNIRYNVSSPQNNIGANIGINGSVAVVPEPAVLSAAAVTLAGLARRPRKPSRASA